MVRRPLLCLATLACGALALAPTGRADDAGFTKLFNGKDLTGWRQWLPGGADPAKTWTIKDGVIECTGKPAGYLITEKEYGDYVLKLQWKFTPGKAGNSGVFVHVSGPDTIWPKGLECQLQSGQAGDFWVVGQDGKEFKTNLPKERNNPRSRRNYFRLTDAFETVKDKSGKDTIAVKRNNVEKPLGEWNQYEITCKGDVVSLVINGTKVNEATGCEATKGKILLQSEGAPIDFRNIEIKTLK